MLGQGGLPARPGDVPAAQQHPVHLAGQLRVVPERRRVRGVHGRGGRLHPVPAGPGAARQRLPAFLVLGVLRVGDEGLRAVERVEGPAGDQRPARGGVGLGQVVLGRGGAERDAGHLPARPATSSRKAEAGRGSLLTPLNREVLSHRADRARVYAT